MLTTAERKFATRYVRPTIVSTISCNLSHAQNTDQHFHYTVLQSLPQPQAHLDAHHAFEPAMSKSTSSASSS